ncbi:hypothetical protein KKD37_03610 [Patescibacteria group bacterium]|nr:hypothetical protein [Patescibacteria group bacterium]
MKNNKKAKSFKTVLLITFLGFFVLLLSKSLLSKLEIFTKNSSMNVVSDSVLLYKSSNLNLSFNYPSLWGDVITDPSDVVEGTTYEYIDFRNNKDLFSVAGTSGRGSIVNGIEIKVYEKTDVITSDGHEAQIIIYTDPENKYLVEAVVSGKSGETFEPFYIRNSHGLSNKEVLEYKEHFTKLLSSLTYSQ